MAQSSLTSEDIVSWINNNPIFDDITINKYKQEIITYIEEKCIDGNQLSATKRKQFGQSIVNHYNNRKMRGAANKTHDKFMKLKVEAMSNDYRSSDEYNNLIKSSIETAQKTDHESDNIDHLEHFLRQYEVYE